MADKQQNPDQQLVDVDFQYVVIFEPHEFEAVTNALTTHHKSPEYPDWFVNTINQLLEMRYK